MWLRTQDKTKLINLREVQYITISKSYGSKDGDGNNLNSAIVINYPTAISLGLYQNVEESMRVMSEIERFIQNDEEKVFQMP